MVHCRDAAVACSSFSQDRRRAVLQVLVLCVSVSFHSCHCDEMYNVIVVTDGVRYVIVVTDGMCYVIVVTVMECVMS